MRRFVASKRCRLPTERRAHSPKNAFESRNRPTGTSSPGVLTAFRKEALHPHKCFLFHHGQRSYQCGIHDRCQKFEHRPPIHSHQRSITRGHARTIRTRGSNRGVIRRQTTARGTLQRFSNFLKVSRGRVRKFGSETSAWSS